MKKIIIALVACSFIIKALFLTGCSSSNQKVDNTQKNMIEANKDIENAKKEYLDDVKVFREETAKVIEENRQSIIVLKKKMEHEKRDIKAGYKQQLDDMELKNNDLRKRMDQYKISEIKNWEKFKLEYSHELDELEKAFRDLKVKIVK